MKAIDRLFAYLNSKGIPQTKFEKELGMSNGYLGIMLKRHGDLGEQIIRKVILHCRDLSIEWLVLGMGDMISVRTPNEIQELKQILESDKADKVPSLQNREKLNVEELFRLHSGLEERVKQLELAQLDSKK